MTPRKNETREQFLERRRAAAKVYNAAHREEQRAYFAAHKERYHAHNRAWYAAHKEERKVYSKNYYREHKDKYMERQQERRASLNFCDDNAFDSLCKLALMLPYEDRFYRRPNNPVRKWLDWLADCVRAANAQHAERVTALREGRPQASGTPLQARATKGDK